MHNLMKNPAEVITIGKTGFFGDLVYGKFAVVQQFTGFFHTAFLPVFLRGKSRFCNEEFYETVATHIQHVCKLQIGQRFVFAGINCFQSFGYPGVNFPRQLQSVRRQSQ